MNKTAIEWCDVTWNPVTGCRHGCEYCYAERVAKRFGTMIPDRSGYPQTHDGCHIIENKIKGNPYPYLFEPTFRPDRLQEPTHEKKPSTIFVCSMADLFGEWVPDDWLDEVFSACEAAPQHRYLFLTKNPQRYVKLATAGKLPKKDHFWYGKTVTKKGMRFFDSIKYNTFLSIEPLLEPLHVGIGSFGSVEWMIIGAETGHRDGKVTPKKEWIDNICDAAAITHIPVFMKDSLLPIMGEENMRRELPWENEKEGNP